MSDRQSSDLRALLRELYDRQDESLRSEFNRSLPFQDGLFDRWQRANRLGFGEGTSIYNSALVFGDVIVGKRTWIGPNVILDGSGGPLEIGDYCCISAGSQIYTHDTIRWSLSGGVAPKNVGAVKIEDRCYIGSQCVIVPNVVIGTQSVVAANAVVTKSVPERTVVGGTPAAQIGRVVGSGATVDIEWT